MSSVLTITITGPEANGNNVNEKLRRGAGIGNHSTGSFTIRRERSKETLQMLIDHLIQLQAGTKQVTSVEAAVTGGLDITISLV